MNTCFKSFTYINPLNLTYETDTVIIQFYRWENWGKRRGTNKTRVRQLVNPELWCQLRLFYPGDAPLTFMQLCLIHTWAKVKHLGKGQQNPVRVRSILKSLPEPDTLIKHAEAPGELAGLAGRRFENRRKLLFNEMISSTDFQSNKHLLPFERLLVNVLFNSICEDFVNSSVYVLLRP